jgi:pyruvate kinase
MRAKMKFKAKKLERLMNQIDAILKTADELEAKYESDIALVHPAYKKSAANLIHYMALRSYDLSGLQQELRTMGLPGLDNVEAHAMRSLLALKTILNHLLGEPKYEHRKGAISVNKSKKILNANTRALFGYKSKKRRTRIMVTLPSTAADDARFVGQLVRSGMNSARVNCAHDSVEEWAKMIKNVQDASLTYHKQTKVMMDLGGPKLRTGAMKTGPQVIHIRPEKDALGKITNPAKVWLAPENVAPPSNEAQAIIPIEEEWLKIVKKGNEIKFTDSRGKKCVFEVQKKQGAGRWATCTSSAYITPGTSLTLLKHKKSGDKIFELGELESLEQYVVLNINDTLCVHKDSRPGELAKHDESGALLEPAHIPCTLPEIFADVQAGEPILFDDGKVEGIIEEVSPDELKVRILHAKDGGSKVKSDKGINLPESNMSISGLTEKDKQDIEFVAQNADAVNLSFVNTKEDVQELIDLLKEYNSKIGIILKIETRKGFNNLPEILLSAMQSYPVGVMIARGDLAVETGWKNIATIQEELLRVCEAAHIPDIWATQVLESLAKKGTPTRAEITDAASSQRAECVMLNKGYYINRAIKLLDRILRKMQGFQKKKETILSQLEHAENLSLTQDYS